MSSCCSEQFSSRRQSISALTERLAREFEAQHGYPPDARALGQLRRWANHATRARKGAEPLDLAAEVRRWAAHARASEAGALEPVMPEVTSRIGPGASAQPEPVPMFELTPEQESEVMVLALATLQESQPTWHKADLIRHLGEFLPDNVVCRDDRAAAVLLERMADRALVGATGERVLRLTAPEWPPVPQSLRRADGRSVYRPHGGIRYATLAQLSTEDQLIAQAQECGAPCLSADQAAQLLGAEQAQLEAQLGAAGPDTYPGDPERSNQLYRHDPLTWEEIALSATCGDEPMAWRVKHDRDAAKEVWLLFENIDGKFPLYPGETTWISYQYTVPAHKWGPWWSRAIRLPTRRLSMTLVFPARLRPAVWGNETSMTAAASPFHSPFARQDTGDEVVFTWSADDPPLHARYRAEWKFRNPDEDKPPMHAVSPAAQMRSLDIVQEGDPILGQVARPFDLPAEAEDARRVVSQLASVLERVGQVHSFAKGMGLAAPQIGIGRAAAVIRTPEGETITLLNPQICDQSAQADERYEGCLSFFDVRGKVPRPLSIEVEHQDVDGTVRITTFERGLARLVCHEVDHLFGRLYRSRMRPGVEPIPVSVYKGTGQQWTYQ